MNLNLFYPVIPIPTEPHSFGSFVLNRRASEFADSCIASNMVKTETSINRIVIELAQQSRTLITLTSIKYKREGKRYVEKKRRVVVESPASTIIVSPPLFHMHFSSGLPSSCYPFFQYFLPCVPDFLFSVSFQLSPFIFSTTFQLHPIIYFYNIERA